MLKLTVARERWPMKEAFRISGYTFTHFDVVVVELAKDGIRGRGEASGVFYHRETPETMAAQIEGIRSRVESGISREALQELLPPGGARAAVDAALWDLEAKCTGVPVHRIAGMGPPRPLPTTYTLSADTPARMAHVARSYASTSKKQKQVGATAI